MKRTIFIALVCGLLSVGSGQQSAGSSQRAAVSSQQSAVSGRRSAVSSQRAVVGGQQSAGSSQRSAGSGQRSAVSGQQSVVTFSLQPPTSPAPMPPDYRRIAKENRRWFGEYRYGSLARRFERGDTTFTMDHFRCLYYGAGLRGDTNYSLVVRMGRFRRMAAQQGLWQNAPQLEWTRLQKLLSAVWSSGDGSAVLPFHVAFEDDVRFMLEDTGDASTQCLLLGRRTTAGSVGP